MNHYIINYYIVINHNIIIYYIVINHYIINNNMFFTLT